MNGEVLDPFAVDLLRLINLYAVDQFVPHTRRSCLRPGVFADGGNEHIRRYGSTKSKKAQFLLIFVRQYDMI